MDIGMFALNPITRPRSLAIAICALALVGSTGLVVATPRDHLPLAASRAAKIVAHLTKTSFTSRQAGSVKLIYRFSATATSSSYVLAREKGSRWRTIKSVKRTRALRGSGSTSVRRMFAGKPVRVGRYRLELATGGASRRLSFKVIAPAGDPSGHPAPANDVPPAIFGAAAPGQALRVWPGSWTGFPTSYGYQWSRCDASGVACSAIWGAVGTGYVSVLQDAGQTIRVSVTARNAYGQASATSPQSSAVVAPVAISAPLSTTNPSLETDTAGWSEHTNIQDTVNTYARATNWAKSGTYSLRISGVADPDPVVGDAGSFLGTYERPPGASGWTVTPGVTYTAQTWNYVTSAPGPGSPGMWNEIFFFHYDGIPAHTALLLQVNGSSIYRPVALGEQLDYVTAACPAGANIALLASVMRTAYPGEAMDFNVDSAAFFEGAAPIG